MKLEVGAPASRGPAKIPPAVPRIGGAGGMKAAIEFGWRVEGFFNYIRSQTELRDLVALRWLRLLLDIDRGLL